MPLQSGSDAVLKRMGRHWYSAERYAQCVERLLSSRSVFGVGADVIVGFPGETQADHARTVALVERLPFTYLHVFPYSVRPGTAAERLAGRVQPSIVADRSRQLREIAARKSEAYRASRVGGLADVVVVRGGDTPEREGVTEDYLTVLPTGGAPRGSRFVARLVNDGNRLAVHPLAP
jgi:threonylcarbamoyladenosine tRNA methylthiotransferase MtaB